MLMSKVPHAGEDHRDAMFAGGGDDFVVHDSYALTGTALCLFQVLSEADQNLADSHECDYRAHRWTNENKHSGKSTAASAPPFLPARQEREVKINRQSVNKLGDPFRRYCNLSVIRKPQLGKARSDGSAGSAECFCQVNDG